jgi:ABC-type antimicrobial peptide transport system permease subunit
VTPSRRACALPGCHAVFVVGPGDAKKYCSTEHRRQARVERLDQTHRADGYRPRPASRGARPASRGARPASRAAGSTRYTRPTLPQQDGWSVRTLELGPMRERWTSYRLRRLHTRHRLDLFQPQRRPVPLRERIRALPAVLTWLSTGAVAAGDKLLSAIGALPGVQRRGATALPARSAVAAPPAPDTAPAPDTRPRPRTEPVPRTAPRRRTQPRPHIKPKVRPAPAPFVGRGAAVPISELVRSAVESLSGNKLRSVLTMLGIMIGIAAVILLVSLGNGMREDFNKDFGRLANQITVEKAAKAGAGAQGRNLDDKDVAALSDPRLAPHIASVSPSMGDAVTLTVGQTSVRSNMVGVTHNYIDLLDRTIIGGAWFTPEQAASKDRVAVIGPEALSLLGGPVSDPQLAVGATIRVNQYNFEIIGVLESDGQNDNVIIVPFQASRSYLVGDLVGKVDSVVVKSTDPSTVHLAAGEIIDILDENHRIREATQRDYNVLTYTNLLEKSRQFITFMALFIVAIAAISLLVGGIGVANIMLVAVTERTREIGIRKAIGATNSAVMRQFLAEAVILTAIGGAIGIGLGVGATFGGIEVLPKLVEDFPAPILTTQPVLVAFGVSLVIGVLAGGYPAYRAARMRPIQALRFQ